MVGSRGARAIGFLLLGWTGFAPVACGGTSVKEADGTGGSSGNGASGGSATGGSGALGGSGAAGGTGGGSGGSGAMGGSGGSGGSGAIGGTGTTGGSGGTGALGGTGAAGSPGFPSCDDARKAFEEELAKIQACKAASDCGQVLEGTSCGCTRDLVARLDADPERFRELAAATVNGEQCNVLGSECDCPETNGFACTSGRCAWNYGAKDPICKPETIGSLCVRGFPIDTGEELSEGVPLMLELRPFGCFSSSCTKTLSSSCSIELTGSAYSVSATICLDTTEDPNTGCTADCGGGDTAYCESSARLEAGRHTVTYPDGEFDLSVAFVVPSLIPHGGLCSVMDL
jgi:hypothetical protein